MAQIRLGNMYYYGTNGVQADYAQAHQFYQQAADHGHPDALAAVGKLYAKVGG
jgi:TPR repeat protein